MVAVKSRSCKTLPVAIFLAPFPRIHPAQAGKMKQGGGRRVVVVLVVGHGTISSRCQRAGGVAMSRPPSPTRVRTSIRQLSASKHFPLSIRSRRSYWPRCTGWVPAPKKNAQNKNEILKKKKKKHTHTHTHTYVRACVRLYAYLVYQMSETNSARSEQQESAKKKRRSQAGSNVYTAGKTRKKVSFNHSIGRTHS